MWSKSMHYKTCWHLLQIHLTLTERFFTTNCSPLCTCSAIILGPTKGKKNLGIYLHVMPPKFFIKKICGKRYLSPWALSTLCKVGQRLNSITTYTTEKHENMTVYIHTCNSNEDCEAKTYQEHHENQDKMSFGQGVETHGSQPVWGRQL